MRLESGRAQPIGPMPLSPHEPKPVAGKPGRLARRQHEREWDFFAVWLSLGRRLSNLYCRFVVVQFCFERDFTDLTKMATN
jgi:hypothetical protein